MKRTPLKRKSNRPRKLSLYVKDTDDIFSLLIRFKYCDPEVGLVECFTCKKWYPIKKMQNGHYIPRNHMATRYHMDNCRPQCYVCNCRTPDSAWFRICLINKHGEEFVENIEKLRFITMHFTREDHLIMQQKFKSELKQYGVDDWRDPYK